MGRGASEVAAGCQVTRFVSSSYLISVLHLFGLVNQLDFVGFRLNGSLSCSNEGKTVSGASSGGLNDFVPALSTTRSGNKNPFFFHLHIHCPDVF